MSFKAFSISTLTQSFVEGYVDFEVAHSSILVVQRLPHPEIPTLFQDGILFLPLFVMPPSRWLYWTETSISNPKIERASMDGTSRTVLHNTGLIFPSGITLDYTTQTLYWIDAGRLRIESSNVDGSNRQTVTTVNAFLNPCLNF